MYLLIRALAQIFFLSAVLFVGCSRSHNLLLGEVQAKVGTHRVTVTDCYRISFDPPQEIKDGNGTLAYRFSPCRDADVVLRDEKLVVNGTSYGPIGPAEPILVDHGVVSIGGRRASSKSRP
jgi:hypothetical protein